jgi:hypothetical protein
MILALYLCQYIIGQLSKWSDNQLTSVESLYWC